MSSYGSAKGFSLLSLSLWMLGIALALAIALALLPHRSEQVRIDQTRGTLEDARHTVLGFVIANAHLPVPDTSSPADGVQNPGAARGALPWRDMEQPAAILDEAAIPVQYAPYRNSTEDADLADPGDLYQPAFPDADDLEEMEDYLVENDVITSSLTELGCPDFDNLESPVNLLDLCVAIGNAEALAVDDTQVSIEPATGTMNVAYVLVSGGLANADGDSDPANLHLDGRNKPSVAPLLNFDDPARGRTANYDDLIDFVTFSGMRRELSCDAHLASMTQLEEVTAASFRVAQGAVDLHDSSGVQVGMTIFTMLTAIHDIALTIQSLIGIVADIPKAVAGCNVPPNVLCCAALGALIAGTVVYSVTAAVQIANLATVIEEAVLSTQNANFIRDELLPRAVRNMCNAAMDLYEADLRGGLDGLGLPFPP